MELPLRRYASKAELGLVLSPLAASDLGLLDSLTLWGRVSQGTLSLGPLIGVLVAGRANLNEESPFGDQSAMLQAIAERGRAGGAFVYFFSAQDADWVGERVTGVCYNASLPYPWYQMELPFPDVVYDRINTRMAERSSSVRQFKQRYLGRTGVVLFPNGFLDKWEVHQQLSQIEHIRPHLPETARLSGPGTLRGFLRKHGVVYLKPMHGSLGYGILRVEARRRGYVFFYARRGKVQSTRCKGIQELWRRLRRVLRRTPYIVQQGLDLSTADGNCFDMRILMQKDGTNTWQRTKMFARIAPPGGITANLTVGAKASPVADVLLPLWGPETPHYVHKLREAALVITTAAEKALAQTLGELGVDLGLDRNGQIWLIELNSKPNRTLSDGSPRVIKQSFDRPIAYARYLAGFG